MRRECQIEKKEISLDNALRCDNNESVGNRQRRKMAVYCALLALIVAPIPSSAQEEEIFFPFVSHLKTEVSASQVKLTWKDPPGIPGRLVVYRGLEELTSENINKARIVGRVDEGVQYFIDTPPDAASYFYGIMVQTTDGETHAVPIDFRNKTIVGVSVRSPASQQEAAARVTGIRAVPAPGGGGFEITFQVSNQGRDLLIFRSTSSIGVPEDLVSSTTATQLDPGTTRTIVAGLPGVDYWFAVLDAELFKLGEAPIARGENTTTTPVELPATGGSVLLPPAPRRAQPLPSLDLMVAVQTGRPLASADVPGLPRERKVSPATEKAIAALLALAKRPAPPDLQPTVLPADATPSLDRDTGVLQGIIKGPFNGGTLEKLEKDLRGFLSLHRSPAAEARAHFYLGQAYFFDKRPRDALLEFLLAEDSYFHESQPWEDACFGQLEKLD